MEVSIDKISLIYTVTDIEHYKVIINYIHVYKDEWQGKGKYYWKGKYSTNVKLKLDMHNDLYIRAGFTYGKLYVKFEFNAGLLSPEGWQAFYLAFTLIFDGGYKTAYEDFRVDYLELAVDFKDIEFNSFSAVDNKVKSLNNFYKDKGSIYLGSKDSSKSYIIYDKAKQLNDAKGISLNHNLIRIERRLKLPKIMIKNIADIKNPFLTLRVFDINKAHILNSSGLWLAFTNLINVKGLNAQEAYLSLSPIERQALESRIHLCKHEWWDAIKAWELAKIALLTLIPTKDTYTV